MSAAELTKEHVGDGGEAIDRFAMRILRVATHYARERIADPDDAADLAQDVAVDAVRMIRCGRLRDDGTPIAGLIRRMVQCRHMDSYRYDRVRRVPAAMHAMEISESVHAWMQPDVAAEESELLGVYESTVEGLSAKCRAAFVMVCEQSYSYQITAEQLDVSRSTVGQLVSNARHLIGERLAHAGISTACHAGGAR